MEDVSAQDSPMATRERRLDTLSTEWYDEHDDRIKVSSGASLNQTKVAAGFGLDRNSDLPVLRDEYIAWTESNNVLEQFKNAPNRDPQLSTWRREWPRL